MPGRPFLVVDGPISVDHLIKEVALRGEEERAKVLDSRVQRPNKLFKGQHQYDPQTRVEATQLPLASLHRSRGLPQPCPYA